MRLPASLLPILAALAAGCGSEPERGAGRAERERPAADAEPSGGVDDGHLLVDAEEAEALRALGYTGTAAPLAADARVGVLVHDRERVAPGLNLFSNAQGCTVQLVDMEGTRVHEWSYRPCFRFAVASLLPNGDLLLVGRQRFDRSDPAAAVASRFLVRLDWDGEVVWESELDAHHDVERMPDGRVATLTERHVLRPEIHTEVPVRDQFVLVASAEGEPLEEASIVDVLLSAPDVHPLLASPARRFEGGFEVDLVHANSVAFMRDAELAARDPLYALGNVLVCMRNQNAAIVVDWDTKELLWSWGTGVLSGPHDATVLANGNVLVFDNGLGRGWSRLLEVDPLSNEVVWEYSAEDKRSFYTFTRGSCQRLSNGNTLVVESNDARAFEVTRDGEVVWDFVNPNLTKRDEPVAIVRMRRYEGLDYDELTRRVGEGRLVMQD